jgi:hypothetical protein
MVQNHRLLIIDSRQVGTNTWLCLLLHLVLLFHHWLYFGIGVDSQPLYSLNSLNTSLIRSVAASSCGLLHGSNLAGFTNGDLLISLLIFESLSHKGFVVTAQFRNTKFGSSGGNRVVRA